MSKTVQLLDSVGNTEAMEFSAVIQKKSKQLFKLLQYLLECSRKKKNFSRETAHKIYYGKSLKTKKDDEKIRQLLSSLNADFATFITIKDFEKENSRNGVQQVKTYFKLGLAELFNKQIESAIKTAEANRNYSGTFEMMMEKIDYLKGKIRHTKNEKSDSEVIRNLTITAEKNLKMDFIRKLRNLHRGSVQSSVSGLKNLLPK